MDRLRTRLPGAAIFLIVFATFWPAARGGFFFVDDARYALNPHVSAGLAPSSVAWALTTRECELYHPATWLSLEADAALYGPGPFGFHLTNVLLHALAALLLCELLMSWGCAPAAAAGAALLFALHPLRVETVAWISERKGSLAGTLTLASALLYSRHARRPGLKRLLPSSGAFLLAVLAKPSALALPVALLAVDVFAFRRRGFKTLVVEKWPFWLAGAVMAPVTLATQSVYVHSGGRLPALARAGDVFAALRAQLVSAAAPESMTVLRPLLFPHEAPAYFPLQVAASALALAALTAALLAARRKWPEGLGGWLWLMVMSVPTLGVFRGALTVTPNRYTWLPHVGLAWAAAGLATRGKKAAAPLAAAAAALALLFAARTRTELALWTDPVARGAFAAARAPESAWARNELGAALLQAGRSDEAEPVLREAVRLAPNDSMALNNFAASLAAAGRTKEALQALSRAAGPVPLENARALREGRPLTLMTGPPDLKAP